MQFLKILLSTLLLLIPGSSSSIGFIQVKGKPASPTLLIFTGSDWCSNCRRLEKKILKDSAFINFIKDRLIIEIADFPQHTKLEQNARERNIALAEKYNFRGIYPTILLLDSTGTIQAEIFYRNQSSVEFINHLKQILKQ